MGINEYDIIVKKEIKDGIVIYFFVDDLLILEIYLVF